MLAACCIQGREKSVINLCKGCHDSSASVLPLSVEMPWVDGSAAMCRIEKLEDGSFEVFYKNKDGESSVKAGIVMFGTGRSPNTKNIGLEVSCQTVISNL